MSNLLPEIGDLPTSHEFPDPFLMANGQRVTSIPDWNQRVCEIKALLLHYQYGHLPPPSGNVTASELSSTPMFNGSATEEHILLTFGPENALTLNLYLTVPLGKDGPFPVVVRGDRNMRDVPIPEEIAARGYIVADFDRTELAPDAMSGHAGAYPHYPDFDWAALAVWAWGYHRVIDYLTTRADVDTARIVATGHSRGGKTALLAGALDDRIALTVPNNSGCGGTGSYRLAGAGSETLAHITGMFPYWFVPRLNEFIGREDRLPFDQHFLMALVAPRPLLITNALGDVWANPEGTQSTYLAAKSVFDFLGAGDKIGNHYREGIHEQNADDWRTLMDFADWQLFGKSTERDFARLEFPVDTGAFSWTAPARVDESL